MRRIPPPVEYSLGKDNEIFFSGILLFEKIIVFNCLEPTCSNGNQLLLRRWNSGVNFHRLVSYPSSFIDHFKNSIHFRNSGLTFDNQYFCEVFNHSRDESFRRYLPMTTFLGQNGSGTFHHQPFGRQYGVGHMGDKNVDQTC